MEFEFEVDVEVDFQVLMEIEVEVDVEVDFELEVEVEIEIYSSYFTTITLEKNKLQIRNVAKHAILIYSRLKRIVVSLNIY